MTIQNLTSDTLYVSGFPLESKRSIRIPFFYQIIISSRLKGTSVLIMQDDSSIKINYDVFCGFIATENSTKELISFVDS